MDIMLREKQDCRQHPIGINNFESKCLLVMFLNPKVLS